jgi:hypothetical protein
MTTQPVSVRFPPDTLQQLRRRARAQGSTVSYLVQTAVDESLRMQQTPGVYFADGPAGRRARVIGSIDVWEIIAAFRAREATGEDAVLEVADGTGQPAQAVQVALDYYALHQEEIDQRIDENERLAAQAERQWQARQTLPS